MSNLSSQITIKDTMEAHFLRPDQHESKDLIRLFDELFLNSDNTRLLRGEEEPIYLPADNACDQHRIVFAHGFFSSALHEISHWCIAGKSRRLQRDYGYWYAPDGRDEQQQELFEHVEVKPQALEWILSRACRKKFRISIDNLDGEETDSTAFKKAVYQQVLSYCNEGLPRRAQRLIGVLAVHYGAGTFLESNQFQFDELN